MAQANASASTCVLIMALLWLVTRADTAAVRSLCVEADAVSHQTQLPKHHVVALCKVSPGVEQITPLTQLSREVRLQLALMQDADDVFSLHVDKVARVVEPMPALSQGRISRTMHQSLRSVSQLAKQGLHVLQNEEAVAQLRLRFENGTFLPHELATLWGCGETCKFRVGYTVMNSIAQWVLQQRMSMLLLRRGWKLARTLFSQWPRASSSAAAAVPPSFVSLEQQTRVPRSGQRKPRAKAGIRRNSTRNPATQPRNLS